MINTVIIAKRAQKQLRRVPPHVVRKLTGWVFSVEEKGIEEVRKIPGYHDEPLTGTRKGQRSIRLTVSYRAIYQIRRDDKMKSEAIEFVSVEEITKHKY
jgi:proteic killer suppression protein